MSKKKYKAQYQITSMTDYDKYEGLYFVIKYGDTMKTTHRGWVESFQYRTLKNMVLNGRVYAAEELRNEQEE